MLRSDDGLLDQPATDAEWRTWVAATDLRNWCREDPLLDWLGEYREVHGVARDDEEEGYDAAFDLGRFVRLKARRFRQFVNSHIASRCEITEIAQDVKDARSLELALRTFDAMEAGRPVIAGGVLRNPELKHFGVADLIVRADVLTELVPYLQTSEFPDPQTSTLPHHYSYRVVSVEFHELPLLKDGSLSASDSLATLAELWVLNQALARLQGYAPAASYVLGRCWSQGKVAGDGAFDRAARVPHNLFVKKYDGDLESVVRRSTSWIRNVRKNGAAWRVLPEPSLPELWPNMKNTSDEPWHGAKTKIADGLADLTVLPYVSAGHRALAHARGVVRWTDTAFSPALVGITAAAAAKTLGAVLAVNRDPGPPVRPAQLNASDVAWRQPAPVEAFIDFEFLVNLDDDFSAFPRRGGQPLIFQIGCGTYRGSSWAFRQFTVGELTLGAEARMIEEWISHLLQLAKAVDCALGDIRLVHWSPAEPLQFERERDNARTRHPDHIWPALPWYDLLEIIQADPLVVRGAFSASVKSLGRALRKLGNIETDWGDGLADGTGAMAGAWTAAVQVRTQGVAYAETEIMRQIARYNEIDCRVMAEILDYLRRRH